MIGTLQPARVWQPQIHKEMIAPGMRAIREIVVITMCVINSTIITIAANAAVAPSLIQNLKDLKILLRL